MIVRRLPPRGHRRHGPPALLPLLADCGLALLFVAAMCAAQALFA